MFDKCEFFVWLPHVSVTWAPKPLLAVLARASHQFGSDWLSVVNVVLPMLNLQTHWGMFK
jgi:hypothetical protein